MLLLDVTPSPDLIFYITLSGILGAAAIAMFLGIFSHFKKALDATVQEVRGIKEEQIRHKVDIENLQKDSSSSVESIKRLERINTSYNQDLADEIVAKLRAATPKPQVS